MRFDSAGSWSFDNDSARNGFFFETFCVDNNSSSHADNHKNNFLVRGKGPSFGIIGGFERSSLYRKLRINFSEANTKFHLILHFNADNNYLFVNGKEIFKLKADNKYANSTLSRKHI